MLYSYRRAKGTLGTKIMRSTFFTACFAVLAGVTQGAITLGDSVTLDIKYTNGTAVGSAFDDYETNVEAKSITSSYINNNLFGAVGSSLTFYIKASDMYSSSDVTAITQYKLNTLSFAVNLDGYYYDGQRQMTVLNTVTNTSCTADYPGTIDSTTHITTLTFGEGIRFSATDILKVTLSSKASAEDVGFMMADRKGNTLLTGAASELVDGAMNYEDYSQHVYDTSKYQNVPIVRLTATALPEPTTATLSLLALVGLAARRRRRQA